MIIDSPIISGSYAASGSLNQFGNVTITGSLTVTGDITGTALTATSASYALTASHATNVPQTSSFADNATSASYAVTASYISGSGAGVGFPYSGSAVITGSLLITELSGSGTKYVITDNNGLLSISSGSTAIKVTETITSTADQTSFTVPNGYTTGLVDVFINGIKLSDAEFTDNDGVTITLATGSNDGDVVEFAKYQPANGVTNNALRQQTTFIAEAGQTVFSASYTPGLLDIFYNGSRLSNSDYTANNGTYFTLATASAANDLLDVFVYSYQVGAFNGIGGTGVTSQIAYFNTTSSITGSNNFTINGSTMTVTGSLLVSGSGTFTNIGPAVLSGSVNISGSLAVGGANVVLSTQTSSLNVATASLAITASSADNFLVRNILTAQTLVVQTITSSVDFVTGSTRFGSLAANTHQFTGSVLVSGSLGIGLSNPTNKLEVQAGDIKINANVSSTASLYFGITGTNYGKIQYDDSNQSMFITTVGSGFSGYDLNLGTKENVRLSILGSNGNVGIGITPSYKLDINRGSSGVVLNLEGTNAYGAETGILMSAGRAKISGFLETGGGTPGTSLRFYTMPNEGSVTERIRMNSDGSTNFIFRNVSSEIMDLKISTETSSSSKSKISLMWYDSETASIKFRRGNNATGGSIEFWTALENNSIQQRMTITSGGRVGIGVTSAETLFDVADGSTNTLMAVRNTSTASSVAKNAMYGFVGTDTVGTPKLVGGMQAVTNDVNWINGNLYWYVRSGDGEVLRMSLSGGGALVISGALTQNGSPSDINLKENLVKISSPLEKISQINGYTFEWKEGSPARGNISNIVEDAGVVAQEIETILPEIVRTSDDNKVVNYNGITALLIEAMKEQQALITELQEKLERNNII